MNTMTYGDLGGFREWMENIIIARDQFLKHTGRRPTTLIMPMDFLGSGLQELGGMDVVFAGVDAPTCACKEG